MNIEPLKIIMVLTYFVVVEGGGIRGVHVVGTVRLAGGLGVAGLAAVPEGGHVVALGPREVVDPWEEGVREEAVGPSQEDLVGVHEVEEGPPVVEDRAPLVPGVLGVLREGGPVGGRKVAPGDEGELPEGGRVEGGARVVAPGGEVEGAGDLEHEGAAAEEVGAA